MAALIPITGIDLSYRVPGSFVEILFAQGPASASAGVREVVIVAPKLSTGAWTAGSLYRVGNEQDAITGAGEGSPLHRAVRKFLQVNKDAKLWVVPVAETTGGSPVAATGTVTFTTNATATGTAIVTLCGEDCTYTFQSGATPTDVAVGICASVNAKGWLPVIASNVAGAVTFTAKLKGISQGTTALGVIRFRATISTGVGTTVATSGAHVGSAVSGAEGSTTEAANLATALVSLEPVRKYYIASTSNDATSWGNIKTHVVSKTEPKRGLRSVAIVAYTGGLTAAQTLAIGKNYERLNLFQQINSEHDCAELVGAWTGIRQKGEQDDPTWNFDSTRLDSYILPAFSTLDWPDSDDQNDAINDGITLVASDTSGAYVVMSVNTRSKNSAGTQDDFRATETHRVSEADQFCDELLFLWALNFQGKKVKNDTFLSDGVTVNPNQKLIKGVITPSQLVAPIRKLMQDHEDAGQLQNAAVTKAGVRVVYQGGGRLQAGFDLNTIDHLHQGTFRVAEVSAG